jgi:hypothetical protein
MLADVSPRGYRFLWWLCTVVVEEKKWVAADLVHCGREAASEGCAKPFWRVCDCYAERRLRAKG